MPQDLMGSSFKRQLQMDGQFDRISFVTTSADDLSAREIIRSIPSLEEEMKDLLDDLDALDVCARFLLNLIL